MTFKYGLKVTQGHSNCTIRKLGYGFLFAFHSNYGSILHQFRDKARYWSKIVTFSYPLAFGAPVRGGPRRNIDIPFGVGKLEWWGYPTVKKNFEDMYNRLDSIPACDRQTNRRADSFWPHRSNLRAILNQVPKFRPNRATRGGVMTSYTISRWHPRRLHTTFGFVFVVILFWHSKSVYRPNFVDISQFTAEI